MKILSLVSIMGNYISIIEYFGSSSKMALNIFHAICVLWYSIYDWKIGE